MIRNKMMDGRKEEDGEKIRPTHLWVELSWVVVTLVKRRLMEEGCKDKEEERCLEEAEWMKSKSELIYDFADKNMDFGRVKATNMKGNSRITLPKAGSVIGV